MDPIIPQGEEIGVPISIRFTKQLLKRIDAAAKATGNNRTDVIQHLVRWALTEYEHQRGSEKLAANSNSK